MEFTGGIHYGRSYYDALNATWPFAHLKIDPASLKLDSTFFRSFTFSKKEIVRLSYYAGFFSKGLRIEHENSGYPPFIIFWTFNFPAVKAKLVEFGYQVEEPPK